MRVGSYEVFALEQQAGLLHISLYSVKILSLFQPYLVAQPEPVMQIMHQKCSQNGRNGGGGFEICLFPVDRTLRTDIDAVATFRCA